MIIFEHIILEALRRLEDHTNRLSKEAHRAKIRPTEIELILSAIEGDFSKFEKLMPPIKTDRIAAVYRHIWFIRKGLREENIAWIENNADDLKNFDVPELKESIENYFRELEFLHVDLRDEVASLLENGEYDSAVRKAFLVLKQKAVEKYRMPKSLDGEDMVNFLFSAEGKVRVHEEEKKRKAFRDMASGFFRFFRNEYMHNLGLDEQTSAQCALSVVAYMLYLVDR